MLKYKGSYRKEGDTLENVLSLYGACRLCPRACGTDRLNGARGACHATAEVRVAYSMLHMWEEPCLSGERGSGAVFFSGCPLGCVYCQNHKIARGSVGEAYTVEKLAELFLEMQENGAHNINLVTAGHYAPHIARAVPMARERGLFVPVVFNTSGYETVETLRMLEDVVDIYLTDFRYLRSGSALEYSSAKDYPSVIERSIEEMVRQKGALRFDENGMLKEGVLVRLLLLPSHLIEAKMILRKIHLAYGDKVRISLMRQYTPIAGIEKRFPELGRTVTDAEYFSLLEYAQSLGISDAYTQEGSAADESFIPDF